MNQTARTHVPLEAVALGLGFLITVARMIYEIAITLGLLGLPLQHLDPDQVRVLALDCLTRSMFYTSAIFTAGAVYPLLVWTRVAGQTMASKTGDLTRGSLAQGELGG